VVDIKDLPRWSRLFTKFFFHISILTFGLYWLYTNYETTVNQTFISLSSTAGVCTEVPTELTGMYYMDSNGNWNSEAAFQFKDTVYGMEMTGLQYTKKMWTDAINTIIVNLTMVRDKGRDRDMAWNLISW
jgi:hypothetical protein